MFFKGIPQSFLKIALFVLIVAAFSGCAENLRSVLSHPQGRAERVDAYLSEFCSPTLRQSRIGEAIRNVMMRLPVDALAVVLDRRRPVIFTEVYDSGTARFASSSEIIATDRDVPAFQHGMTILKISTALETAPPEAITGIVAHELAHRVLDHVRKGHVSCQAEREANRQIKAWGFTKEYEAASQQFGQAKEGHGVASCQE